MSARPCHALGHVDFRRLWLSQMASQVGTQMQVVALDWHAVVIAAATPVVRRYGLA